MELKYQPIYKCVHKALCINFRALLYLDHCVVICMMKLPEMPRFSVCVFERQSITVDTLS